MASTFTKYAKHTTTIHRVTRSRGTVTETKVDANGYLTEETVVAHDESGVHLESRTIIMYPPTVDVVKGDRIEVDGKTLTVESIAPQRFVGRSPNHLEVRLA